VKISMINYADETRNFTLFSLWVSSKNCLLTQQNIKFFIYTGEKLFQVEEGKSLKDY